MALHGRQRHSFRPRRGRPAAAMLATWRRLAGAARSGAVLVLMPMYPSGGVLEVGPILLMASMQL